MRQETNGWALTSISVEQATCRVGACFFGPREAENPLQTALLLQAQQPCAQARSLRYPRQSASRRSCVGKCCVHGVARDLRAERLLAFLLAVAAATGTARIRRLGPCMAAAAARATSALFVS